MSTEGDHTARAAWAFMRWLDKIPTANNPNRTEQELAEADAYSQVIENQTTAARKAREAEQAE